MPCVFTFVDVGKKGITGRGLRNDTNFLFLMDWLAVFGFERVTSKEAQVPWIRVRFFWDVKFKEAQVPSKSKQFLGIVGDFPILYIFFFIKSFLTATAQNV